MFLRLPSWRYNVPHALFKFPYLRNAIFFVKNLIKDTNQFSTNTKKIEQFLKYVIMNLISDSYIQKKYMLRNVDPLNRS